MALVVLPYLLGWDPPLDAVSVSVPRFLRQVIRYGAPPVWGLVGSVLGIGILGVVTLARKVDPLWVALAAVGFIGAVFVVGAYRAWRDAERFRPSWELAQHRADTVRIWLRATGAGNPLPNERRRDELIAQFLANHGQAALMDFNRVHTAGYLDWEQRQLVAEPKTLGDIERIAGLFEAAAKQWQKDELS